MGSPVDAPILAVDRRRCLTTPSITAPRPGDAQPSEGPDSRRERISLAHGTLSSRTMGFRMTDSRLLGTWRSDARRTGREISARRDIPTSKATRLRRLFGKLELRYTKNRCYATLGGDTQTSRYRVVARDASTVALVFVNPVTGAETVSHVHFDGEHHWICLGSIREYFRRTDGSVVEPAAAIVGARGSHRLRGLRRRHIRARYSARCRRPAGSRRHGTSALRGWRRASGGHDRTGRLLPRREDAWYVSRQVYAAGLEGGLSDVLL